MTMSLPFQTTADLALTHQVIFTTRNHVVNVSCNCRLTAGKHEKAGKLNALPIGPTKNIEESRRLYNNPANHWAPFTDEDKAKW